MNIVFIKAFYTIKYRIVKFVTSLYITLKMQQIKNYIKTKFQKSNTIYVVKHRKTKNNIDKNKEMCIIRIITSIHIM